MQVVDVKSIDGAIELADQTIRLQQHAAVIIRMLVGGNHQLCLRFKHQSLVSVGSNPRRLVCLADLKSASLDHSGKIPRQMDTNAPARKRLFPRHRRHPRRLGHMYAFHGCLSSLDACIKTNHHLVDEKQVDLLRAQSA